MRFKLRISEHNNIADYSRGRHFRFAVLDLDRGKEYPLNYVCMLPLHVVSDKNPPNVFVEIFGEESLELAKQLLRDALKVEDEPELINEIEWRLKLFEPELTDKVCASCGKIFQIKPKRRLKQKFCQQCLKKKFGDRIS